MLKLKLMLLPVTSTSNGNGTLPDDNELVRATENVDVPNVPVLKKYDTRLIVSQKAHIVI